MVTLRIDLKRNDGEVGYAEYKNFKLASETDRYRLQYGDFVGDVGDSLYASKGEQFSTADQDNDGAGFNCALSWKGGWWYRSCFEANLNNDYYKGVEGSPTNAEGVMPQRMSWKTWRSNFGDITFSEMKLRRVG